MRVTSATMPKARSGKVSVEPREAQGSGGPEAPMPWLQLGDRRVEVKALQRELKQAGIPCGPIDGYLGPVTQAALKRYQQQKGLVVDGQAGPQTWGSMGKQGLPKEDRANRSQLSLPPAGAEAPDDTPPAGPEDGDLRDRLLAHLNNPSRGIPGKCLKYASQVLVESGGMPMANRDRSQLPQTQEGRGQGLRYLDEMARQGTMKVGDLIYVNKKPGADPRSNNMAYGPHWFIYAGQGQYIDQHGIKSAAEMQNFVKGRVIDTVFHPFD